MGSSLQEQIGVASGALHWDVGGFRLWQSTAPGVVLYVARELRLARESDRRYHAAVTQTRRWTKGSYEVTGGSALLGVFGGEDPLAFENEWVRVLLNKGYKEAPRPKFLPLPVRDVSVAATLADTDGRLLPPAAGQTQSATLLFELTPGGAQTWPRAVLEKTTVPGSVRLSYTYPQMLPGASARVQVHGARVYTSLAAALDKAADGTLYGSFADIRTAWSALVRDGAVAIALAGQGGNGGAPPADLRERLSEQAREQLFDVLFASYAPANPPGNPPAAGEGTLYALRWRSPADAIDPSLTITVEGWTWLSASLQADMSALLGVLDESYLHLSYEYASVPVTVAVAPFKAVSNLALSLDFGNVHAPEAPLFDAQGGTRQFLVTTERPETVQVAYRAKVAFQAPSWPVVEIADSATLGADGYTIVLKPETWVRRHTLYMYVRAGNQIVHAPKDDPADYLAVTANYSAPYLPAPIRDAARITPAGPVELSYPVPPGSMPGRATLNVVGMVGGQMVSASQLELDENEDAVYLLVDGNKVQLVGKLAVADESDPLVERLRAARSRPVVVVGGGGALDEEERDLDVSVDVSLIPQPTEVSCWAAALAMVVGARDFVSIAPETVAEAAAMDVDTGYAWGDIQRAVATWNLAEEGPRSAMPDEWARLLQAWGPIWVVEVGAPYHAVVLAGVRGDGTPDGTWVTVYNPWPPGVGAVETKTFLEFDQEFGLGADAGAAMVHAVGG